MLIKGERDWEELFRIYLSLRLELLKERHFQIVKAAVLEHFSLRPLHTLINYEDLKELLFMWDNMYLIYTVEIKTESLDIIIY